MRVRVELAAWEQEHDQIGDSQAHRREQQQKRGEDGQRESRENAR
jgi:hypothetical protein